VNQIVALAGQFLGLIAGGLLASIDWHAVFWVSVPFGVLGTVWSCRSLRETSTSRRARIDWAGNITFALGTAMILAAMTYGIQPYGGHPTGWTNPKVIGALTLGFVLLVTFVIVETRVAEPMFRLALFRMRAFTAGNLATLMTSIARGGLQFMLIIWLQGIWLPLHGYDFQDTPLWAGIYMLPLTAGFLVAGPTSGYLSDRFGPRLFATGGLLLVAVSFVGLILLPVNFPYPLFALMLLISGIGQGMFSAPNTSAIMSSVPPNQRGVASGMRSTCQNAGTSLSIGIFFSLMIAGLANALPKTLTGGLTAQGVPGPVAAHVATLPPVSTLFAAFLGSNPIQHLLGTDVLGALPAGNASTLTGREFFPHLISGPFHHGLVIVFGTAAGMSLLSAVASFARGKRPVHVAPAAEPPPGPAQAEPETAPAAR
jgi:MFS family permease